MYACGLHVMAQLEMMMRVETFVVDILSSGLDFGFMHCALVVREMRLRHDGVIFNSSKNAKVLYSN